MSDERRTPENLTGADDQAFGEALGSAIRGRVDAPAARPPVSSIAERAAARAKARNARRSVAGIAASVALVAGGIVAWNALEDDRPTEVIAADDPTASPAPEQSAEPAPAPTSETRSEPEGAPLTDPEVGAEPRTPESLSAIPAVAWTELEPTELSRVDHMVSVGDGRVLAQGDGPGGTQVMVTENGRDWTVISMPPGLTPERFDITSARWLVTGTVASGAESGIRAFFSDDQGTTWTELALDIGGGAPSVTAALVSGDNMVIAAKISAPVNISAVIVGRGLVPDAASIQGWMSIEGSTVTFVRDESSAPESFELTAEEEDQLYGGDRHFIRLYHSDNGAAEQVAEIPAWHAAGYGAADGFHLVVQATEGLLKLTSPDGRNWGQAPLTTGDGTPIERSYIYDDATEGDGAPIERSYNYDDATEGTVWTSGQASSDYRVERSDGVYVPALVAELPRGIRRVNRFAVGPAGIAMVASPGDVPVFDPVTIFRAAKDGYELRFNGSEGTITLWDVTGEAAVYVFDAKNTQDDMLPEGVQMAKGGDGDVSLLVFDDPESGEHLVTFAMDELEPQISSGNSPATLEIRPEQAEQWVGWSADGTDWSWQTLSNAFGLTDLTDVEKEFANAELTVGADFVMAQVKTYEVELSVGGGEDGDSAVSLTPHAPRWYIAAVQ